MIKRLLFVFAASLLAAIVLLLATGHGYIFTAIQRTYLQGEPTANINDHTAFRTREIAAGKTEPWPMRTPLQTLPDDLLEYEARLGGAAFLVIHEGAIIAEHYTEPYDARSLTNSFSVAKSVTALLLGIAIDEGLIESLEQPLVDWLPEFAADPLGQTATVRSLLTMTSGYRWDEHYYSPFSPTVQLLYGSDVESFLLARDFSDAPESRFYYSSASTQLLGLILTRAIQTKHPDMTLSAYLSERLWQPLGMNESGLWHLDNSGMELNYCCINTNARNFAKFGQLLLNRGRWGDQQLVSAAYVDQMTAAGPTPFYGYSVWMNNDANPGFVAMRGHLGQYVISVPEDNLVVVRLGEQLDASRPTLQRTLVEYVRFARGLISTGP